MRSLPLLFLLLAAAGCRDAGSTDPERSRRVAIFDGAEADFPVRPTRILPGNASATSFIVALVERERIPAIPIQAFDYAAAPLVRADWEPDRVFTEYLGEDVLGFDPDVVVTHDWQNAETTAILEDAGVSVLRIPDASSFAELVEILEVLGRVLVCEDRAAELIGELEERREALRGVVPEGLTVLSYSNFGSGGFCAGQGTSANMIFELCGVRNAAADRVGHAQLGFEELYALDPDVIVVGSAHDSESESPTADFLRSAPGLAGLRAIREDSIVILPARLFTANSHHVLDAAERLASEL